MTIPNRGSVFGFVLRRWFLLLLLATLAAGWSRGDSLRPWVEPLPPRWIVGGALFLLALGLETRTLLHTASRPAAVVWAVVISFAIVPALAWLLGGFLPDPGLHVGLILIASTPCTLSSGVFMTRLAGGCEATALLVSVATTALATVLTPLCLTVFGAEAGGLAMTSLIGELLLVLLLPIGLGQALRVIPAVGRTAHRCRNILGVLAGLLVLVTVLKAAVSLADHVGAGATSVSALGGVTTLCAVLHLLGFGFGLSSSRLLGFDPPRSIAVAFTGSQKALPVSLYLFESAYRETFPLALLPLVLYHAGQLILDSFLADALHIRQDPHFRARVQQSQPDTPSEE